MSNFCNKTLKQTNRWHTCNALDAILSLVEDEINVDLPVAYVGNADSEFIP